MNQPEKQKVIEKIALDHLFIETLEIQHSDRLDFHDVSVEKQSSGAPRLVVTGRALALAESHGVGGWHVSITHTDTVAMAVVAAL